MFGLTCHKLYIYRDHSTVQPQTSDDVFTMALVNRCIRQLELGLTVKLRQSAKGSKGFLPAGVQKELFSGFIWCYISVVIIVIIIWL